MTAIVLAIFACVPFHRTFPICGQPAVLGWTVYGECCDGVFVPVWLHREVYLPGDLRQFQVVQNSARPASEATFIIPRSCECG